MRARHMMILCLLAAVPIGLAFALTGGGAGSVPGGSSLAQITFKLQGGRDAGVITACGKSHHFQLYGSRVNLRFHGTVVPAHGWSVSVKLKACYGGAFQSAGSAPASLRSDGTFTGSFPAPIGGLYEARAYVRRGGAIVTHSDKRYFEIR